mgnify:CR=1 FL=1
MDMSSKFTGNFKTMMTEAQTKTQEAFEKSSTVVSDYTEFAKGNVEAMVESTKIFAAGLQEIGSGLAAESRTMFETFSADMKEMAAVKSPTDLVKLQGDMVRKNMDTAVAYGSKNTETMLKLFSDSMQPISNRMTLAVEKARSLAA